MIANVGSLDRVLRFVLGVALIAAALLSGWAVFDGVALKSQYCPVVLAVVINGLVQQAKATLDPSLAMRIVFEAAIPMSKINPLLVDA